MYLRGCERALQGSVNAKLACDWVRSRDSLPSRPVRGDFGVRGKTITNGVLEVWTLGNADRLDVLFAGTRVSNSM